MLIPPPKSIEPFQGAFFIKVSHFLTNSIGSGREAEDSNILRHSRSKLKWWAGSRILGGRMRKTQYIKYRSGFQLDRSNRDVDISIGPETPNPVHRVTGDTQVVPVQLAVLHLYGG